MAAKRAIKCRYKAVSKIAPTGTRIFMVTGPGAIIYILVDSQARAEYVASCMNLAFHEGKMAGENAANRKKTRAAQQEPR